MNQTELKNKIIDECQTWFVLGCEEMGINAYDYNLDVEFFYRGQKGGSARCRDDGGTIRINFELAVDNQEEYFNQTIPHEVAHVITRLVYGVIIKGYRTKRINGRIVKTPIIEGHGMHWQYVMRKMGKTPDRCHNMDTSKVKQNKTVRRWIYACPSCKKEYGVTSQKHTKISVSNGRFFPYCKKCNVEIHFTGEIRNIR